MIYILKDKYELFTLDQKFWLEAMADPDGFYFSCRVYGVSIYRTYERAVYWRAHQDESIAEWMPVNYVAHSYHVPPPVLFDTLKLKPKPGERRKPLGEIAVSQGRSFDELKADLEKAIAEFRRKHPTPPGGF